MAGLIQFLEESRTYPKVFWKSRGSKDAFAGYGMGKNSGVTFGGMSFSPQVCSGVWSSFPSSLFFSPEVIRQEPWEPSHLPFNAPTIIKRQDTPDFNTYWMLIEDVLKKMEKEGLKKVVPARQTTLTYDQKINPFELLRMLNPWGAEASIFFIQLDPQTCFLGATPEKLFHRQKNKLKTEALAGTKDRCETWTAKESSEVEAVQIFLQQQLLKLCSSVQWNPPGQRPFGNLKHLYQSVEGDLKDEITDHDLISYLHPTPALGGFPVKQALDYLAENEPIQRGWYGAPFGMISPIETDIAVAIRSALILGDELHLFSAAGIVPGSHPHQEWNELDRKIAHYLRYNKE